MRTCLTQHYKVRIKGNETIQRNEKHPSLHVGVLAIEKGAFESTSNTVGQLTYSSD